MMVAACFYGHATLITMWAVEDRFRFNFEIISIGTGKPYNNKLTRHMP